MSLVCTYEPDDYEVIMTCLKFCAKQARMPRVSGKGKIETLIRRIRDTPTNVGYVIYDVDRRKIPVPRVFNDVDEATAAAIPDTRFRVLPLLLPTGGKDCAQAGRQSCNRCVSF